MAGLRLGLSCLWSFLKVVSSDILFFTFFPYHDDIHAHLNCLKSNHGNEYFMWDELVTGEAPQGVSTYNVIFAFLLFSTEKISGSPKTPNRPSMEIMTAEGFEFLRGLMLIYVKRANFTIRLPLWTTFFAFPPSGECSTKFYTWRLRPKVQPLTLLYTIFDRKRCPFRIPSEQSKLYPLVQNFASLVKVIKCY